LDKLRVRLNVRGMVQGVGYRYFVKRVADAYGLTGWVKNSSDGSVEVVFDGPEPAISAAVQMCRRGPAAAVVEDVVVMEDVSADPFDGFTIRFD